MAEEHPPRQIAGLMVLTFTSGIVDAVGFIALGHVFCALATGNVLFLGLAVAGEPQLGVSNTCTALAAFVTGLALSSAAIARLERRGRDWFLPTIGAETAALLGAAAVSWGLVAEPPGALTARHYVVVALMALAMGMRTATTHRLAVPGMSTVLITTSLALLFHAPDQRRRRRYALVVAAIGTGAGAGTLLLKLGVTAPLLVAAGCAAVVAAIAGPGGAAGQDGPGRGALRRGASARARWRR